MSQAEALDRLKSIAMPEPDRLGLDDIISIYQALRPIMPQAKSRQTHQRTRLVDLVDDIDAFILDGYGVINVGDGPIAGIDEFFAAAEQRNVPVIVLTNGASFGAARVWQKYVNWGLPISESHVVSSRDSLEAALTLRKDEPCYGSMGANSLPLGLAGEVRRDADVDFYERADEIVLLGVTGWNLSDQSALEVALWARPRPIHVANPDVASPQQSGFSAEPGYWAARAMIAAETDVFWYGKPHHAAFAMAFDRLQTVTGRQFDPGRVAMVGDSLHTDIIGASAFGLQTILMTGHGLFRDGGAGLAIENCGIYPDWLVATP